MTKDIDISVAIEEFRQHALTLSTQESSANLEQAIIKLAQWITLESGWLSKSDRLALGMVGGMMFREQVAIRRAAPSIQSSTSSEAK
ncbi:MAG: hypothetical protein RSD57_13440 [Comamonas sp.]